MSPSIASDDTRIARAGDWLAADTGDGYVMMSPTVARYVGLSATGGAIWALLETPLTLSEICALLAKRYEITAEAVRPDVVEFVEALVQRGALKVD